MFKNEEGFSLLELVVAVGVAGIIAAVALPTFAGIQDKATTTSATYAASASAAEALANSTIGTTGSTSSYTGGASSSSQTSAITYLVNPTTGWSANSAGQLHLIAPTTIVSTLEANPSAYKVVIEGGSLAGTYELQHLGGAFGDTLVNATYSTMAGGMMYPQDSVYINFGMSSPLNNKVMSDMSSMGMGIYGTGYFNPGTNPGVVSIQLK